jgi:DeoR family glycerol-3-phosphate regulon repressor
MNSAQRQGVILGEMKDSGFVSVPVLAQRCGVSEMTVRRDLDRLADSGLLERMHGGAAPIRNASSTRFDVVEPSLDQRHEAQAPQKLAIARAAARMIIPGQTIALDIGTTTGRLAAELGDTAVSIYTTSLRIAASLASARPMVYLPGGLVAGLEPSIVGSRAIADLRQLNFEIAFLGASGLSDDGILFDYSLEDAEVKRAFTEAAQRVVLLLDSSKFNRVSVARICSVTQIDTLITDCMPPEPIRSLLAESTVEVIIAV